MRVEFRRPGEPDVIVASATYSGGRVEVHADEPTLTEALSRVFRATPVVVDDPSYRTLGTRGAVVVQPATLEWFRAAAQTRAGEFGLVARLVPGIREGGFDPAAQYRTFGEAIERLAAQADP